MTRKPTQCFKENKERKLMVNEFNVKKLFDLWRANADEVSPAEGGKT